MIGELLLREIIWERDMVAAFMDESYPEFDETEMHLIKGDIDYEDIQSISQS